MVKALLDRGMRKSEIAGQRELLAILLRGLAMVSLSLPNVVLTWNIPCHLWCPPPSLDGTGENNAKLFSTLGGGRNEPSKLVGICLRSCRAIRVQASWPTVTSAAHRCLSLTFPWNPENARGQLFSERGVTFTSLIQGQEVQREMQ